MKTFKKQTLCVCGCCKRSLPVTAFYINKKTGLPGNYCKECRKSVSRNYRENEKHSLTCDRERNYPVITCTEDPVLRRKLILHALATVAASIERKKRKVSESELETESQTETESESELMAELTTELRTELTTKSID